ncbi:fibronectin type III domain-containing protein [Actinokineospora pegani]|uniref:fibronectin type III domain-containing protein n=1 Tax=Actinokineospora pegani TaxID=2654637 RepID=UPI0012EAA42D|nr:fibronectin type III domain-containing protein [Actinokineospora pegani]
MGRPHVWRARRLPVLFGVLTGLVVMALVATPAVAFWTATGAGSGSGVTTTLAAPTGVTVPPTSSTTVAVSWTGSTGSPAPTGYYVLRDSSAPACASSPSALITGTSCDDTGVAAGTHTYRVVAVYRSWTATSAASGPVVVSTASKLAFSVQPTNATATLAISPAPQVVVQDASGAAAPGAGRTITVAIGANPAGGTLSGTVSATTNASGVATFPGLSVNRAGAGYTLTAASTGLTSATSSPFAITAGAASRLVFTASPATSFAGRAFHTQPVVAIQDAGGNVVTSSTATVSVALTTPGGATLTCTAKAAVAGVATFTGCLVSAVGTHTLTATSGALTPAVSTPFQVIAAPTALNWVDHTTSGCAGPTGTPAALTYTYCFSLLGNGTVTSKVQLVDGAGNAVVNVGQAITITLSTTTGGTTPTTLTIPHGASVSTGSTTFTPAYLLNPGSTVTAASSGFASATATLRSFS